MTWHSRAGKFQYCTSVLLIHLSPPLGQRVFYWPEYRDTLWYGVDTSSTATCSWALLLFVLLDAPTCKRLPTYTPATCNTPLAGTPVHHNAPYHQSMPSHATACLVLGHEVRGRVHWTDGHSASAVSWRRWAGHLEEFPMVSRRHCGVDGAVGNGSINCGRVRLEVVVPRLAPSHKRAVAAPKVSQAVDTVGEYVRTASESTHA